MNNFYNELAPVKHLANLGTTIPTPALSACISALLCVYLGNSYGTSNSARPEAKRLLDQLTPDRWEYYLNHVLPSDMKILNKLLSERPRHIWINDVVIKYSLDKLTIKNITVNRLIQASSRSNNVNINTHSHTLRNEYYGKNS